MSKISELSTLNLADVQVYADMIPIVDASTGTTKKIPVASIQGYTSNANPYLDISALCTSAYTIAEAKAVILSGRLCYVRVMLQNGTTGISKESDASENILTLPDSIFSRLLGVGLNFTTRSELSGTAAYECQACLPIRNPVTNALSLRKFAPINPNTSWVSPFALYDNGNIKCLVIETLAVVKYDVPELPFPS